MDKLIQDQQDQIKQLNEQYARKCLTLCKTM